VTATSAREHDKMNTNNCTAPKDNQTFLVSYCVLCRDYALIPPASCSSLQSVKHEHTYWGLA